VQGLNWEAGKNAADTAMPTGASVLARQPLHRPTTGHVTPQACLLAHVLLRQDFCAMLLSARAS